ncbi:MAG: hypothetical protein FD141_758 [Fusobacteria bacterium]|nr:MAG: hypothetical protein FD141_758 [Fusobacteriota bacterium]KAF0228576.1 MAG: hypothetical protein FD182_832 [Fusobacteriota bacterium]
MKFKVKNKVNFIGDFWQEAKKINWKQVNKDSLQSFRIVFIGNHDSYTRFINDLEQSRYDFLGLKIAREIKITSSAKAKLIFVDISKVGHYKAQIVRSDIIIVDSVYLQDIREQIGIVPVYNYEKAGMENIVEDILNDNDKLGPALAFNFPVFRTSIGRQKIIEIAKQNAIWAAGTSVANIIPGPQQLITAPLEGFSDFTVLTTNELRMVFITAGICGRKIEPLKLIPELMIMLGGAKGAQILATQTLGKVPAGAGNILKAAIAFAFTFAIGEAVFLNMNYGVKIDSKKIGQRVELLKDFSKEKVTKFIKK